MGLLRKHVTSTVGLLLVSLLTPLSAFAALELNMPEGVSTLSKEIYGLHMTILAIVCVIGVVVYGGILYTLIKYRKSNGHEPAKFTHHLGFEIVWTVVPTLILIVMAIPATEVLRKIYDTSESEVDILITGYQWKWHYKYLEEDIAFFSNLKTPISQTKKGSLEEKNPNYLIEVDKPLVIPSKTKVRFLLTANDVIHAWWMPDFGVKKDAVPGFINEIWTYVEEEGHYRGACAELCGRNHGYMPIEVIVKSPEDYKLWLAEQKGEKAAQAGESSKEWSLSELSERGEKVYETQCAACHQPNGEGMSGVFPAIKGSAIATGDKSTHIDIVMLGKAGTAMQAYANQLNDIDLAAVLTYQRNAWGNNTGDKVSTAEIQARR